ncbi:MAG: YCF48-related protein [Bacteroidota bacterium]|nr:YCF48-related protein [Bacteroidota bacterium]
MRKTRRDTTLTLTMSYTGINFSFVKPVAQIVGYLKGEDNHILQNVQVRCYPRYGSGSSKYVRTDVNGFFQFGFSLSQINSAPLWGLQSMSDGVAPTYFPPHTGSFSLHEHDSIRVDLTAYLTDDYITGRVTVDGKLPNNLSFNIRAHVSDSGQTNAMTDPTTGNFTLHVTRYYYNYYLGFDNLPAGYGYDYSNQSPVHPGNSNITLNIQKIAWLPQTSNTSSSLRSISFVNNTIGWIGGTNGSVLKTINSGTSWMSQTTNTSNTINGIFFINDQEGWFVANGGMIKKTTDGGTHWNSQISPTANNLYAVQFINGNTGWAVGGSSSQGTFLKTIDGGTNWNSLNPPIYSPITSLSFISAEIGWIGTNSGILKTTDGGTNWDWQYYSSVNSIKFLNESVGWAARHSGIVYYTSNGGADWTQKSTGQGVNFNSIDCIDNYNCWVAGNYGNIFRTTDGGSTWVRQLTNKYDNLNAVQFVDLNNGWAVGDNGTILHTTNGGSYTSVKNLSSGLPSDFLLFQNYPNPFNPSTIISFSIPSKSFVSLKIFDILGREVAAVVSEELPAGSYSRQWNAVGMTSGVYFYRLLARDPSLRSPNGQAGQVFISTKKFILMK